MELVMAQVWLKDIRFVTGVRDPNVEGERGQRLERVVWTKDRPFVVEDEGGWLKFTGNRCCVWTPKSNVQDAVPMSADEQRAAEAFYAEKLAAAKKSGVK